MSLNVAVVELGGSHAVCIYSQLLFLKKGGYTTTLIYNERLEAGPELLQAADVCHLVRLEEKGMRLWVALWQLRSYLIKNDIHIVVFNTAQSNRVRNLLLLPFPKNFRFCGTLHQIEKLANSVSQRSISRKLHHYFVLNDYLVPVAKQYPLPAATTVSSYYPVFFPAFHAPLPPKEAGRYWVSVPGGIEYKRRDYEALLYAWAAIKKRPPVCFILGNAAMPDGARLRTLAVELDVLQDFVFFDDYVSESQLHAYLQRCDAVMPLIHPEIPSQRPYAETQLSGNCLLAFAYRKPLLMHRAFAQHYDFRDTSFFYDLSNLPAFLEQLPALLATAHTLYADEKWTLEYQTRHYLNFINT